MQVKDYSVQFNVVSKGLDSEGLGAQTVLVAFCAENKLGSSRECAVLRAGFYLEQSLLDMQDLCVRTDTKAAPRPKL